MHEHIDLARFNTLRLAAVARYFVEVRSYQGLVDALSWAQAASLPVFLLGGGSNILLASDFPGLVIRLQLMGRYWQNVTAHEATLVAAAGENWHDLVVYAATLGYCGLENLALIPGTVGAAPIQNIGAYGVELKDVLAWIEVYDRETGTLQNLLPEQCAFGYRESLFKQQDRYVVLSVALNLSRQRPYNLAYRDLFEHPLAAQSSSQSRGFLHPMDIVRAVVDIRQQKLPDPLYLPNAGSFFKNPVISEVQAAVLEQSFPGLVSYPDSAGRKLAAAWLIDQCGWKGFREGDAGVHQRQALVLVNHGRASGTDILALAKRIADSVHNRFGVLLEMEPRVVGV